MTAANEKTELTRLGSGEMFNAIAGRYDRLNRIISFGVDKGWRKKLVLGLGDLGPNERVLDVATGTADVAIDVARARPGVAITGLEFLIAFLQAYIFTILTCIYINDAIHLH